MSEFEYCYWLMGIFELGNIKEINSQQLVLLKEHLKLVTYRKHTFCNWLEGFFDANDLPQLSDKQTSKILEKLRNEFLTVIDKSYPKELWDALYAAHEGKEVILQEKGQKSNKEKPKFEALC